MSFETDLKDAFARHEHDVETPGDAWERIERGVRGAHRRRAASITVTTLAVAALVATAVPQITGGDDPNGFVAPPPGGRPGIVSGPGNGWPSYASVSKRLALRYPPGWRVGGFEDSAEFTPPTLQSLIVGEPTFSVEIQHRFDEAYDDGSEGAMRDVNRRPALVQTRTLERGGTEIVYRIHWGDDETLHVLVHGTTEALWSSYHRDAENLVETIEQIDAGEVRFPADEIGRTAMAFLEARIDGTPVEPYMTAEAARAFGQREGWTAYTYADQRFLRYRVAEMREVAGEPEAVEFTVEMTAAEDRPGGEGFEGHSGNGVVERFTVTRMGDDAKVTAIDEIGSWG